MGNVEFEDCSISAISRRKDITHHEAGDTGCGDDVENTSAGEM
jgi:hypothetical protein